MGRRRRKRKPPPPPSKPNRQAKRKQWRNESMVGAMAAVQDQGISANQAAKLYGVPPTSLKDRLSGRVIHGTKPGPVPYLNVAEEDELEKYVVDACELGYGKTRRQVKGIVEKVAVEKGTLRSTHVTDGWWTRFFQRHPKLSLRSGDATAHVRMNAVSNEKLKHYFSLLKKCLDENDLCSHPERIYNMDETGVPLDPKPPKVLCRKGQKKIRYRSTGNKSQITVLGCANATGQAQPPFVIFDAKQLNILWSRGEVPGTRYGLSKNGWTDQELFNGWLQNHFLKHAVQGRPLMLLIDGHSSHYDPESIRFAKENSVIIFCLPPHTTHEAQPLDVSLFGPLKQHWREVCHQFLQSSQGKVVSKLNFSQLFSQAWMKTITAENICSGFRRAGIVPFNPGALNLPEESCPANPAVSDSSDHDDQENNPNVANAPGPGPFFTDEEDWLSGNHPQSVSVDLAPAEQCGSPSNSGRSFTAEEEDRFARRFTEGYDLHDPKYEEWLSINHPRSVSVAGEFVDVSPLTPAEQSRSQQTPAMSTRQCPHLTTPVMHPPSMVHSPSVSPIAHPPSASPVVRTHSASPIACPPSASPVVLTPSVSPIARPPASPIARPPSASRVMCTPTHRRSMCSVINSTSTSPSLSPLTPSTSKSCPPGTTSTSLLGKHLKPLNRNTTQKTGQARVLTSDDCLRNLEEKKRKKETEAAEKEQRKLERERKKKEREEEIKRKKEEVKRKKEERERKRMNSQAKRTTRKGKNTTTTASVSVARSPPPPSPPPPPLMETSVAGPSTETSVTGPSTETSADEIAECTFCYAPYTNDGQDWIECGCGQWIHVDCMEDMYVDDSGRERFCPMCLNSHH